MCWEQCSGLKVIPASRCVELEGKVFWHVCEADHSVLKSWPVRGAQVVARMGQSHQWEDEQEFGWTASWMGGCTTEIPGGTRGWRPKQNWPELPLPGDQLVFNDLSMGGVYKGSADPCLNSRHLSQGRLSSRTLHGVS